MTEQLSTYLNDELYEKDAMFYTYILRSISNPAQRYVGHTADLRFRLAEHNSGKSPHTAKFRPWKVETYIAFESLDLKTAVGGEVFLTQRSRDAENAEKIENLWFYRSDLNNLLFHPLGDVLLQRNLMHSSSYSQNSRHSLRSQPLCGSA